MRKMAVFSFLFLITVIGGLLFWQWSAYSEQHEHANQLEKNVSQQIIVETTVNKLNVIQTIVGLSSEKEYSLNIPDNISDLSCTVHHDKPCQEGTDKQTFIGDEDGVTFSYSIPFQKDSESLLLTNWTLIPEKVSIQSTKIEIAESVRREGVWIAGAPLIGYEKLDLIDYYVFEGNNQFTSLYWQNTELIPSKKNADMLFYLQKENKDMKMSVDFMDGITTFPFTAIVMTDKYEPTQEKGLIITESNLEDGYMERQLATQFFLQRSFEKYDEWFYDLFASLMVNESPLTKKGKKVLQELKQGLSEAELTSFFNSLQTSNTLIDVKSLDQLLAKIRGLDTRFFQLNSSGKGIASLYFFDPKQVVINNKKVDMEIIIENNKRLFPFAETMEALDFEVNHFSNQILLSKQNTLMRFYLNKNIFIYNEEDFGLLENPLKEMNGNIYIEQKWLQSIFEISITEEADQIKLNE